MKVTFTRTGEKRYRVSVEGPNIVPSYMDPAPGYDPLLPHDMAHFVVENTLGLMGGVFGQIAIGGTAGSFQAVDTAKQKKIKRRGKKLASSNRKEAALTERVIFRAQRIWMKGDMSDVPRVVDVSDSDIERVCTEFERVSTTWSKLRVGESMTLEWTAKTRSK
jgi:hypothetical protein